MRKIEIIPYQKNWPLKYQKEAEMLKSLLGEECREIHHIGSTSVPGLRAKPTIDILIGVNDTESVDQYNKEMRAIGYDPKGENGIAGRRYFQKGGDKRSHHVHIFEAGSFHIHRHLVFRDYLRACADIRIQYGELKEQLSQEYPYDSKAYVKGKESMVQQIEQRALAWYQKERL
ncbi:GrpB family protein [Alkalibacillus silvisoli]|uniref:GrpB family protein n=1 Tax=Alkalibacillus silvisoli TaxID=392823 RepID=A0ABN1ABW9_9BACI